ncbi:phosphate-starvation-inducible PsiE family protein [Eilatimonas milleporae]|uniref:Uncharacterized membrane protein (DUF373 family) n=1 Tax=Eilatimonas milleporae TaxID=911205 RepID=A0A3M0C6J0_9PROT|nr:phosphate-starvation-inducible PsiE family protein [Eilatimonas milleporae]RMB04852.1 uncharacterized membrane protein (DUF373 family) [Eilatimonas milleporae]
MPRLPDDIYRSDDPLIFQLKRLIRVAVRILAILMTVVIFFGVIDVGWVLYKKFTTGDSWMLTIADLLATFGAFMVVLIAIEIFVNITVYLRDDVIHVKIVMATALMAIARKVIILDYEKVSPEYIYATAAVVFAMSLGYWLICILPVRAPEDGVARIELPRILRQKTDEEPT